MEVYAQFSKQLSKLVTLNPYTKQIINNQEQQVKSNLGNGQCRAPLFLKNVETNTSIAVDVWVEYLSPKCNLQYCKTITLSFLK